MFSDMLAERRRQLGYSIRQASRVLRLREDIIVAFEEGDFERMPKSGYAQGMLSSYARYLGLDANMVVEAYVEDFERYKREGRRRGRGGARVGASGIDSTSHVQPYVPSTGLLPTSGGPAGDMGSFATTRVRSRGSSSADELGESSADYTQVRPYTELNAAAGQSRGRRQRTEEASSDRRARTQRGASQSGARTGNGARSASNRRTSQPRRSTGSSSGGSGRTSQNRARSSQRRGGSAPSKAIMVAFALLLIGLCVGLVLFVGSCSRREPASTHTIPVSSSDAVASEESGGKSSANTSKPDESTKSQNALDSSDTQKDSSKDKDSKSAARSETSVSVKVANGAVTWLEVECDGTSEVAETITGPWQRTYTVEDAITIQAGDTTAVSVVQDGSQVQFESMASGIGTIRIQANESDEDSASGKSSKETSETDESDEDGSPVDKDSLLSSQTDDTEEYGYDEYGYSDDYTSEYDEEGYYYGE